MVSSTRATKGRARGLRPCVEGMETRTLLASQPLVIAALGDSLTDEYQFYGAASASSLAAPVPPSLLGSVPLTSLPPQIFLTGRDGAKNWVENIGANSSSQLSFGEFQTTSRGATRLQGYQENWALSGTAAGGPNIGGSGTTFAEEYQGIPQAFPNGFDPTPGLITQTTSNGIPIKNINVVTIIIGGNDYVGALASFVTDHNPGDFTTANTNIENGIASAIKAIQTAATNAGNTSLKFVLVTTPDITDTPLVQDLAGSNLPILKFIIGGKVQTLETNLFNTYKGNPAVGVVSSNTIINQFIANPVIDGVKVNMTAGGQDYTDGFVGDGFHPGTIVQGLISQAVVKEINTLEGAQVVDPITNAEIVNYAKDSQPTITFTSSASTTTVGQGIRFQAQVTPPLRGAPVPTGTVTFEEILGGTSIGTILGTANVGPTGAANVTIDDLPAGSYAIAAIYNGNQTYDARLSSTLTQTVVTTPAATKTSLLSSSNPASPGTAIAFTAIVSAQGTGLPSPTGAVTFQDETTGRSLGSATLNAQGVATLSVTGLGVGSHNVVASYAGAGILAGSHSNTVTQVVAAANRHTTTQIVPTYFQQNGRVWVALNVVVAPVDPSLGTATGTVRLSLGAFQQRTLMLNNGRASISFPLALLAHRTVSAYYSGNGSLLASGSAPVFIRTRP